MEALIDELDQRQEKEKLQLQEEIKLMLKGVKKNKKRELETLALQMEYDLRVKHVDEMNFLEENGFIEKSSLVTNHDEFTSERVADSNNSDVTNETEHSEIEIDSMNTSNNGTHITDSINEQGLSKKEKAQRKKNKKIQKEKEKLDDKEKYKEIVAVLPNQREIELSQLNLLLAKEGGGYTVKQVEADGHCLYRAVADQLRQLSNQSLLVDTIFKVNTISFIEIRQLTADYMRTHVDEYAPFLGFTGGCDEYDAYCNSVESVTAAEWGGQTELNAIAACLRVPIWVYEAGRQVLKMGSEHEDVGITPLRLAYHRHFYALGEHYNSIQPIATEFHMK